MKKFLKELLKEFHNPGENPKKKILGGTPESIPDAISAIRRERIPGEIPVVIPDNLPKGIPGKFSGEIQAGIAVEIHGNNP